MDGRLRFVAAIDQAGMSPNPHAPFHPGLKPVQV